MSRRRTMDKILTSDYISIGELVRLSGCRYSTLKFYAEEGMLPYDQPESNLTRRFPRVKSLERLNEILALKEKGLSIPEIKDLLTGDSPLHL